MQSTGADNWTIRRAAFVNCQTGVQLGAEKGRYWNMTVENSFFEGFHPFKVTCGGPCSDYAFRARTPNGQPSYLRLYYNTMASGISLENFEPGGAYELVGNLVGGPSNNGGRCNIPATDGKGDASFTKVAYNLFTSGASACGRTNVNGRPTFVNTDNGPAWSTSGCGQGRRARRRRRRIPPSFRHRRKAASVALASRHRGLATRDRGSSVKVARCDPPRNEPVVGERGVRTAALTKGSTYRRTGGGVVVTFDEDGVSGRSNSQPLLLDTERPWRRRRGAGHPEERSLVRLPECLPTQARQRRDGVWRAGPTARRISWIGVARFAQSRCG